MKGIISSSFIAQRNSSKSMGYMGKASSSEGMRMSLTFFLMLMSEPVSM